MGDARKRRVRLEFHPRIRLEFHGARLSSDGGLLAYRELDECLGLTAMVESWLVDTRLGLNKRHALIGLLRQAVYARLAGYEDLNDAERLRRQSLLQSRISVVGRCITGILLDQFFDESLPVRSAVRKKRSRQIE